MTIEAEALAEIKATLAEVRLDVQAIRDHLKVNHNQEAKIKDFYSAAALQEQVLLGKGMSAADAGQRARVITDFLLHATGVVGPDSVRAYLDTLAEAKRDFALKALRPWIRDTLGLGPWIGRFGFARQAAAPKTKAVSKQDVLAVYEALPAIDGRAAVTWHALYYSGLRANEVLSAGPLQINIDTGAIDATRAHAGKTKKAGVSFVPPSIAVRLGMWANHGPLPYKQFHSAIEQAKAKAGVQGLTAKDLRRHWADAAREAGLAPDIIDVFQGRAAKSVLAKHYTSVGQETLRKYWLQVWPFLELPTPV